MHEAPTHKETLMIRRTITTLTLAAVTMIGVATAAPALATSPPSDPTFTVDVPLIDPCIVSCTSFDWDLGGLLDPAPASDDPADPGITIDVPGIVVDPDILIVDVPLDAIIDLAPPAEGAGTEDPAPVVDEDIERLAPIDPADLRGPGDTETPTTPPLTAETAPGTAPELSPAPSEEPHVEGTDAFATTPGTPTTTVTVPEPATTTLEATGNIDSSVTSDAIVTTDDAAAALDVPADGTDGSGGFNAGIAAMLGTVAALALAGTAAGAYRIGRNRA